ncbi:MAG: hypothetical protein R2769_00580 [Saprospiraceae bacterium]
MTIDLIDWLVMIGTMLSIVLYGVWKTRNISSVKGYLLGERDLPWWTIGLSIMATRGKCHHFPFNSGSGI